ncbi:MAG: CPBP family intramembrane metalloprotease [Planctomycetes bacterium]|nr:CPBP family intramembrane metalloprotease [Planctomycetota bacterium]
MVKVFDISPLLAEQAAGPGGADDLPPAARFVLVVTALGLLILAVWLIRRLAHGRKVFLHEAPGRPNSLGWVHVAVIVGWMAADRVLGLLAQVGQRMPETITTEGILGAIVMYLFLLAIALAAAQVGFRRGVVHGMGLSTRRWITDTARGLLAGLAVYPICMALAKLSTDLIPETFQEMHSVLVFLNEDVGLSSRLLAIAMAVVVAPIVEEVIYRGLLQTALRRVLGGPWRGIVAASLVFMVAHVVFATDPLRPVGLQAFAPVFALAVVLGYNYERTGRLLPSIIVHAFFNAVNVTVALLEGGGGEG